MFRQEKRKKTYPTKTKKKKDEKVSSKMSLELIKKRKMWQLKKRKERITISHLEDKNRMEWGKKWNNKNINLKKKRKKERIQ